VQDLDRLEAAPMQDPSPSRPWSWLPARDCQSIASIEWQTAIAGVMYVKVRCIAKHWFFLPADHLHLPDR
jgi:hypothetical protein